MAIKHGVRARTQLGWYEAGLPVGERKQRGHFSTPLALVDQMLDACGYCASADLRHLRVLDPACGSGNFLARAVQRLCCSGLAQGLDQPQIGALVQRNIWGLDPDPVACCLAEMQVGAAIDAACETHHISCRPHIHQADSLALSWQPCVDLLLANPPYLATKNTDLSNYRQARQRIQTDSYLLFLDLALRAVRPGGWIGLVLPDPVLARANAAPERARLLSECTLHHIWHLSGVFAAEVGAAVLIGQKIPPHSLHQVAWTRTRWHVRHTSDPLSQPTQPPQTVSQELLKRQPGAELRYLLSSEQGRISERLRSALDQPSAPNCLLPLADLIDIKRGEELGRENVAVQPLTELADDYPVLRGGVDLRPYAQPKTGWSIARAAIKKPIERYLGPKLLVVKSTEHLQAALDTRGHVVLQTLYVLRVRENDGSAPPRAPDARAGATPNGLGWRAPHIQHETCEQNESLPRAPLDVEPVLASGSQLSISSHDMDEASLDTYYFLLALLNSRLLHDYVAHLHTAYKLVQPQLEQGVLARLPVAWGELEARRAIAERARELERACSETGAVVEWGQYSSPCYEEQERAIRALYAAAVPGIFC